MFSLFIRRRYYVAVLSWILSTTAFAEVDLAPSGQSSTPAALFSYVETVLNTHPELKAADATVAAAQARAEGLSQPLYNPELSLDAQRAQSDSYSVGLNQMLDLSGKRSARRESGQKLLEQVVADRTALRQKLATEILTSLADYQSKQAALGLAQQRLELMQRFSSIADQQYQAGDTGILDRNLGNLALTEAVALTGRAELEQLQARRTLDAVTRNSAMEPPGFPTLPPASTAIRRDFDALAQALPQVRASNARNAAAQAEVDIARSNSHADPTIGIRGGREASASESGKALIGLQLSIPLFVRNNYQAEQAAATATAEAARIETAALYQQALARMKASAGQYRASFSAFERWQAASGNRLDNGIELLDKVWKAREISTAEYLLQLKQLLDGRLAGEEIKYQVWRSWAEWLDASGLWREALSDSNGAASPVSANSSGK